MASTQTTRRRTSSLTVRRAMTITARCSPSRGEQLEEARLERAAPGFDGVDAAAGRDERGDEVRDPLGGERPDRQPVPVDRAPEPKHRGRGSARRRSRSVTRRRTPSTATTSSSDPGRDDPAVVEDDHPVADPLDLGQQVRVEDDRRAAVAGGADDRADVGRARPDRAPTSARRGGRAPGRRAARRRARVAAASPSRSR